MNFGIKKEKNLIIYKYYANMKKNLFILPTANANKVVNQKIL